MNIIEKITESIFFKDLIAKINSLIDNSNEVGGKVEFLEEIDTSKFEYLDDIENKASKTELSSAISTHNTHDAAHNDIRLLIQGLSARLNALADSDDTTLDQMSEIVAYIKANKSLIESITTDKISVSDIIDNLETNLTTKPLSAAQGVVLKSLIDTLNGVINELTPSAIGALSKNQGAANVGKVLVVGTDGNVIPMMLPTDDSDGDIIGVLDESNNILITGDLADGTYTLKYENEDGTYTEIGELVVGEIIPEPTNLFVVGGEGYILNGRTSSTGADRTDSNGCVVSNYIDVSNGDTVYLKNATLCVRAGAYTGVKLSDGSTIGVIPDSSEYITNYSVSNGITQFTINHSNADYIRIVMELNYGTVITDSEVTSAGIIIAVNEPLT